MVGGGPGETEERDLAPSRYEERCRSMKLLPRICEQKLSNSRLRTMILSILAKFTAVCILISRNQRSCALCIRQPVYLCSPATQEQVLLKTEGRLPAGDFRSVTPANLSVQAHVIIPPLHLTDPSVVQGSNDNVPLASRGPRATVGVGRVVGVHADGKPRWLVSPPFGGGTPSADHGR